jgi:hypothetical protein
MSPLSVSWQRILTRSYHFESLGGLAISCSVILDCRPPALDPVLSLLLSSKVKVTLRLMVSQSVLMSSPDSYGPVCGAPLLTRGLVCHSKFLLVLASAVILGSESFGTLDPIYSLRFETLPTWLARYPYLYPQEQGDPVISPGTGFPLRRLLRLAGSRWRYSTPPPYGLLTEVSNQIQSHEDFRGFTQRLHAYAGIGLRYDHALLFCNLFQYVVRSSILSLLKESSYRKQKTNSLVLVRKQTIPTERPPLVDEVSANFSG